MSLMAAQPRVALLVSLLGLLAGCAAALPPPGALPAAGLERFYRVDAGVFRSAQPSAAQFLELQQRWGIRSVIKLNSDSEGLDVVPPGMKVYYHPIDAFGEPSREQLAAIARDLDTAAGPVLVHCEAGRDRTGIVIALYRVRHGSAPADAWAEAMRFGFRRLWIGLEAAFTRETGYDP